MIFFETIQAFLSNSRYRSLLWTVFVVLVIGTVTYHYLEEWTWLDSFYFSFITLTTIGYGDFAPTTDAGKIFTIIYIIIGVGVILSFINTLYFHFDSVANRRKRKDNDP